MSPAGSTDLMRLWIGYDWNTSGRDARAPVPKPRLLPRLLPSARFAAKAPEAVPRVIAAETRHPGKRHIISCSNQRRHGICKLDRGAQALCDVHHSE